MKRKIAAFVLAFLFMSSTYANAVEISLNDSTIKFCGHTGTPFIDSANRTQVPLRVILESVGAEVDWIPETQMAVAEKNGITVEIPIGESYILKNGVRIPNDTAAIIKDSRTFLPIRAVLEAFGATVGWKSETQTVTITGEQQAGAEEEIFPGAICLKSHPGDFTISTDENYPGNILIVKIEKVNEDDPVRISTDVVKINAEVFKYDDHYIAVMPIDLYSSTGNHDVSVIFNEGKDNEYKITKTFSIKSRTFKTQYLVVSESLNQTNNNEKANLEYVRVVKPARTISDVNKLWEGGFIMPVEGRLTTDFAEIRYTNNVLSTSRHSGIDIAAPSGTPILAPNNGIVTLAAAGLLSTGNTVVIDHGMGLFTSYYHLNSMNIQVGDSVNKGDTIGTVGTTGFSTGAHLHYMVSIYNTNVNTYQPLSGIID